MFSQKTVVITGGTRGIGYATAEKFLQAHAKVVVLGSKAETVEQALQSLREECPGETVLGFHPHLDRYEEVEQVFSEIKKACGSIDVLINNAGITATDTLYDYKPEDFDRILNLNVRGLFYCCKAAASHMKAQGGGVILNTSSMVSLYGQSRGCGYPASKFAVNGLTKSLARELGKDKIRVNAVAPGVIETDMFRSLPQQTQAQVIAVQPLGRVGKPEDIANAFFFLASDDAAFISGAILSVDGAAIL